MTVTALSYWVLVFFIPFWVHYLAKDPHPFSSLLHHLFQPIQKQLDISGSVLAAFFQYILSSFSALTQNCAFWSIAVHYHMGGFPWE